MTETKTQRHNPQVARTRQRAIEATLELMADIGLPACTFDAISERSGVARSTLYRHWSNPSELIMDALNCEEVERVVPDIGNLRDDMLTAMLELGNNLEHSPWGRLGPQLIAAASIEPEMRAIQTRTSQYHLGIDVQIIERAIDRDEIPQTIDAEHAALLFSAPIFYRHLYTSQPIEAKWIKEHVDRTVELLIPS